MCPFISQIEDLERLLDSPLHVLYLQQLSIFRERALKAFKRTLAGADGTEFDAMMQVQHNTVLCATNRPHHFITYHTVYYIILKTALITSLVVLVLFPAYGIPIG
jgi:hypothetical protein